MRSFDLLFPDTIVYDRPELICWVANCERIICWIIIQSLMKFFLLLKRCISCSIRLILIDFESRALIFIKIWSINKFNFEVLVLVLYWFLKDFWALNIKFLSYISCFIITYFLVKSFQLIYFNRNTYFIHIIHILSVIFFLWILIIIIFFY